jgi:uncharacterized protein YqeY
MFNSAFRNLKSEITMVSLEQIEKDLSEALKKRDQLAMDTLRGLKTRLQNEKIAKLKDLTEDDITTLIKSEVKRRKEAATAFETGGRKEMAEKELTEASILEKYLPAQMSEEQIAQAIDKVIEADKPTAADFGKVMGKLKGQLGNTADGSILARILKERLK